MMKNGVCRLKKLSILVISILALLLAGCKTLPAGRSVNPIELLDNTSGFYIAIPKAADEELINRVIQNNIKDISPSDAKNISGYINKIYCSLNRSKKGTEIQAAIDSTVPTKYLPKILNTKNGWQITKFAPENSKNEYQYYSYNGVDIAFPSAEISCLGRDVQGMISRYDTLSSMDASDTEIYSDLDENLVEYLLGAENEIRFYANKPQSFLTILTGAQLDLKLIDVNGAFVSDPKHENQYLLNLDFRFRNDKYLKAGRTLLTLAFGLTNSQSIVIGTNELQINGIKLDKQQLYKLFVL